MPRKEPFDIAVAFRGPKGRKGIPKSGMFELAGLGYNSPFEQVVACIISVRTRDEVTLTAARRLFSIARTPAGIAHLPVRRIDQLVAKSSFHEIKARNSPRIARRAEKEFGGALPADEAVLRSLPGVGAQSANLVLGIAGGLRRVSVDVHVHRVTNRWGSVQTRTPEQTMTKLKTLLPARYLIEINELLVPFGKHVCMGRSPHCSTCPLLSMCQQVGVVLPR